MTAAAIQIRNDARNCPAKPGRTWHRYLWAIGICFAFIPSAFAINIPEGTNKLQLASEITKQYLTPLGLKGKTAAQAIEILLAEGFRCGLEPVSNYGLDLPPRSICVKQPSGFGSLCDFLDVSVHLERMNTVLSRADLLKRLDAIRVDGASAFCPYPSEVSADFLAARSVAEESLRRQVDSLELPQNAKSAYEKLLLDGFYCGFTTEPGPAGASSPPKLMCTKQPTGIKYCFTSKLTLDIDWPTATPSIRQSFGSMNGARIKSVQSSCEVPAIKRRGGPL